MFDLAPSWKTPICTCLKALFRGLPVTNPSTMGYENLDPAILAGKWPALASSFAGKRRRRDESTAEKSVPGTNTGDSSPSRE